jgi:nitroreductase
LFMELTEAIKKRRSIRKYKRDPIPDETIREVLEAAMDAPSAGNLQSRYFFVVSDQSLRKRLAAAAYDQNFIGQAPIVVVVCTDHRIQTTYGERGIMLYAIMDCAAAIQNMMLCAYSLGLGTCWVGAFNEKEVTKLLNIPSHFRPVAIVPLGYPNESPLPPPKMPFESACEFR